MSRQTGRVTDIKKVSGELFSLTYGALVAQILKVTSLFYNYYLFEMMLLDTNVFFNLLMLKQK